MKANRFGLATLLAISATSANAQSSVTLYGIVDGGVGYISNVKGHGLYTAVSEHSVPSFFGFRGMEDLGGGTAAIFDLQSEYQVMTGKLLVPGTQFNRKAYVGLEDQRWGTLTLGHQPSMAYDVLPFYATPAGANSIYSMHQGNLDELANTYQFDNAVKYWSPSMAGLKIGGEFAFGGVPGNFGTDRKYSFGIQYQVGSLSVGAAYSDENNRLIEAVSFIGLKTLLGVPLATTQFVIANNLKNFGIGASYAFQSWIVRAAYTRTRLEIGSSAATANTVDANTSWNIAPTDTLSFGVTHETLDSGRWLTFSLTNVYSLSKRTGLYQEFVYQKAFGSNGLASLFAGGVSSNQKIWSAVVGIRHAF
ncbi:porin [Trinickia terrae]|uniref:Porin n=1 Tax=Trinickia terrae TaxID=2571161 RepID=A0A4U1I999_9BURK|nr:porin [Trinickia terrae]TKC90053.1 porin [Trinickia terrae]